MIKYRLIVLIMIFTHIVSAQDIEYEQYTMKDGLPSMQTYNIVQDNFGMLWIGTENGLVSFDGDDFVRYSHPEFIDNDIVRVVQNRNGRIYLLNLSGQLSYLENDTITIVDISNIEYNIMNVIARDDKDFIVTRNNSKVYEIINSSKEEMDFKPSDLSYFIKYKDKALKRKGKKTWVSKNNEIVKMNKEGNLASDSIYYLRADKVFYDYLYQADLSLFKYLSEHSYNRLVVYESGAYIIQGKGFIYYNALTNKFHPLLSDLRVNTIFEDSDQNTWISTPNKGLLFVSNLQFQISQTEAIPINPLYGISDIFRDKNGNIYLGSLFGDVIINPKKENININISNEQRPVRFFDNGDEIFVFNEFDTRSVDCKTLENKDNFNVIAGTKSILIDSAFAYIGTSFSLAKYSYNEYVGPIEDFDGYAPPVLNFRVSYMHRQRSTKTIYFCTTKGLYKSDGDTIVPVDNKKLQSLNLTRALDGDDNSIWVASSTQGIFNVKNDSILYNYNTTNGLISNNVVNIERHENELLVSTNLGLCIIDLNSKETQIINKHNFLPTNEVLVCKVIDGKYWIGTTDGLTILSKDEIVATKSKNSVLSLKKFFINGVETDYKRGMKLDHSDNNIQLNLQHISFKSKKDKFIKYRIPVIDSTWITTNDKNIRMPSLNPGKYHLEAVGVNSIGLQSKPLNIYFTIDEAWWNKSWVRVLGFLIVLGIGNSILIFRARRIRQNEKIKRDYLTQINKIKDQALQLQMNPHFIFNSLNAIQGFIGTDDEEKAMNYLARFARLIRLIFEHSKGSAITLEEELEFINLYLNLEKLRFKDKVEVKVSIDEELRGLKDIVHVPPLLIQPIVENSFKHGLFHKKGKGNLKISYSMNKDLLQIVVEDDGIGRVESQKIIKKNTEKQTSSGIKTTMERIDLLNFGKEKKLNSVKIEDLYDDEGRPTGTRTILNLAI